MTLQDYTTEELKAELKRRSDLAKAEKAKVKRCRMCKHWGVVDFTGKTLVGHQLEMMKQLYCSKPCEFFRNKSGKRVRCHAPTQPDCEHFEPITNN